MTNLRAALNRLRRDDEGVALITVLLSAMALIVLLSATLAYALGSLNASRRDQDWNASLSAAESGIDDYIHRLNQDGNYFLYGPAPDSPTDGNDAFDDYVPVAGPLNEGEFKYESDASNLPVDGTVRLKSSGKVRDVIRTLDVTLRPGRFLDYLYFTEYETVDPAAYTGVPFTATNAQVECAHHFYDVWTHPSGGSRTGRHASCSDINFITQDVINGPLHTNDAILISGNPATPNTPLFNGETTTSWNDPAGKRWRDGYPGGGSLPKFAAYADTTKPKFANPLTLPPSNTAIKIQTVPPGGKGCLFTGPTYIKFWNSQVEITSPLTRSTKAGCLSSGTYTLPADFNGVIYVQNVPVAATDANYTNMTGCPSGGFPYPLKAPRNIPLTGDLTQYPCRNGDVFVEGTLNGRVTVAAENNIIVLQSGVQYVDTPPSGDDLLGLVADNYVEIYHPIDCQSLSSTCEMLTPATGRQVNVHAAILAVKHSFRTQNYRYGSAQGALSVKGAIIQTYRGAVGTFVLSGTPPVPVIASGHPKDYVYDTRLKYLAPPYFLDPVKSAWKVTTWAELPGQSL